MQTLPEQTLIIIKTLQQMNLSTILYGSQGVSLYLGKFKKFGDIDLLVDKVWVDNKWSDLIDIMSSLGYSLQDEHEHEFIDDKGTQIGFADNNVLIRDKITDSLATACQNFVIGGTNVLTLKPQVFLKAYQFSVKDGYRMNNRGKKDVEVIALLEKYLTTT